MNPSCLLAFTYVNAPATRGAEPWLANAALGAIVTDHSEGQIADPGLSASRLGPKFELNWPKVNWGETNDQGPHGRTPLGTHGRTSLRTHGRTSLRTHGEHPLGIRRHQPPSNV